ncbi:glucosaminidase domain-containing protein [Treponema sp. OMZ 840]
MLVLCRLLFLPFCVLIVSCVSFSGIPKEPKKKKPQNLFSPSPIIANRGIKTALALERFFMAQVPDANVLKVRRLSRLYVFESSLEGINSDIAFAQMCLETGFLRFGGLVTEDMNNFCGLGAINAVQRGNRFNTEQEGVRAHIQHLKAYGSAEALRMPLIDPRYKWVNPKGKAPTVYDLSGTWASDPDYGKKLADILKRMSAF